MFAESYGYEIDDYVIDLDGDGVTELITNCIDDGDDARHVYVYRRKGSVIERGTPDWDKAELLPDGYPQDSFTLSEFYNEENRAFLLSYAYPNGSHTQVTRNYPSYEIFRFDIWKEI